MNSVDVHKGVAVCGPACQDPKAHLNPVSGSLSDQAGQFFAGLFDTSDWPPRWHCGSWSDFHGWLYIISDLLIWASYFAIPILLVTLIKKRSDIPFPKIFWLFGAFIILCGVTHFMDALMFWWPAYRLSAVFRLATGIVSTFTVFALYKILPQIYSLRTVKDLEKEIQERKLIDDKLAQSEFLLSEAGRMGRLGGWESDLVSGKATWSKTVFDIYELPYDFPTEKHDVNDFFREPYNTILLEAIDKAARTGQAWDLELKMVTAKKNIIWVRSYGEALHDENGKVIRFRGLFMDIDKYKQIEVSLNKSIELISQHNMQLKSFTHILSHNIRNHASNISLITTLVDEKTLDQNNSELFQQIKKVSVGLNSTLEDLSEIIKIRESALTSELLSFNSVTNVVLQIIESEVKSANAKIHCNYAVEKVNFPRIYLESIILNLLSNSIKYRKEGVDPEIFLSTYLNKDGFVVLECRDNGIGIDLKLHGERIFGLYKTFHNRKDAHGVGLFLIKTQVESQGGEITVESAPNEGSVFKITFDEKN